MKLKTGVITTGVAPELIVALMVAAAVWRRHGQELVVTSLNDSRHSVSSLHYAGAAADLRTHYFQEGIADQVAADLRQSLGNNPDYDVVVESDHIHLEWQPKRRN
jgi:hypothetical protein